MPGVHGTEMDWERSVRGFESHAPRESPGRPLRREAQPRGVGDVGEERRRRRGKVEEASAEEARAEKGLARASARRRRGRRKRGRGRRRRREPSVPQKPGRGAGKGGGSLCHERRAN